MVTTCVDPAVRVSPWAAPRRRFRRRTSTSRRPSRPGPGSCSVRLALLPLIDFGAAAGVPTRRLRGVSRPVDRRHRLLGAPAADGPAGGRARRSTPRRPPARLLSAAMEHADDLMLIMTPGGRIEYANGAFCRPRLRPAGVGAHDDGASSRGVAPRISTTSGDRRHRAAWRGTLVRRRR